MDGQKTPETFLNTVCGGRQDSLALKKSPDYTAFFASCYMIKPDPDQPIREITVHTQ
ncbi:hypothetical protein ACFOGG_08360 [Brenneria rubrifaciens]|uniref:hypothetical protein n=1 Tax=Brenneria rubrifaciens TaxID=55213 RepID=UPI003623FEFA